MKNPPEGGSMVGQGVIVEISSPAAPSRREAKIAPPQPGGCIEG
jgi:hypothetical protein